MVAMLCAVAAAALPLHVHVHVHIYACVPVCLCVAVCGCVLSWCQVRVRTVTLALLAPRCGLTPTHGSGVSFSPTVYTPPGTFLYYRDFAYPLMRAAAWIHNRTTASGATVALARSTIAPAPSTQHM